MRFETQTRTKLLGSAKALARALYDKRHADGYPGDLVRVQHEGVPVFTFSLLDRLDEAPSGSSLREGESYRPTSREGPGLPFGISTSHDDAQAVDDLKAMWEGMPFRASGVTVCFSFGLLDGRGFEFTRLQDDCGLPEQSKMTILNR